MGTLKWIIYVESGETLLIDNHVKFFMNFTFYRSVSNKILNKNTMLSDINSSGPNNTD